jgi:asparagine synthase (glutamine-hydrolysing)
MCGITGVVGKSHELRIQKHTELLKHRGPDDVGYFSDTYISLGHRRLSILDLSENGHQPMFSSDKRYVIVFNGEIYNHKELRKELALSFPFHSTSDTETILYGYIAYGTSVFAKLNGIFALAIYDTFTKELVIARDQFGVKPLYYYANGDTFLFSSEMKSFASDDQLDKTLDHSALLNYIHFLWCPGPQTPFLHVKKLPPGHLLKMNLSVGNADFVIEQFYEIPYNGNRLVANEKQLIDELEHKLFTAVERQLQSDVPVGFFLSGGLDSSAIVAMAQKVIGKKEKQVCYTIDLGRGNKNFEGFSSDLFYAEKVASALNLDLRHVLSKTPSIDDFDRMIWHLDEPQADLAPLHVLNIATQARNDGFKVLLGGAAGDDLFSGYRRHQSLHYEKILSKIPSPVYKGISKALDNFGAEYPRLRRLKKLVDTRSYDNDYRLAALFGWGDINTNKSLFSQNIAVQFENINPNDILIKALGNIPVENDPLNKMLFWDTKYFLTDHNLNYTDKLSMAVGVESRVPFLDLELVDFACRLPVEVKMKGKTTKYLLKKLMERYLPKEVIYRPKAGFAAPVREWITGSLKEEIMNRLDKEHLEATGLFNMDNISQLVKDNLEGKTDGSYTILSILSISSWLKQFVK